MRLSSRGGTCILWDWAVEKEPAYCCPAHCHTVSLCYGIPLTWCYNVAGLKFLPLLISVIPSPLLPLTSMSHLLHTRKVSYLFFLRKPCGFQLNVPAWGNLACVYFFLPVIVIPGEYWVWCFAKKSESNVLLPSFCHFPYKQNPTRVLNTRYLTQMLLVNNWRFWQAGKIHKCVCRLKVASSRCTLLRSIRFPRKENMRSDVFLTE